MFEFGVTLMVKKSQLSSVGLQAVLLRATRLHFVYIAAFMASIIVFDSWNLITHQAVANFWTAAVALLVINTVFWYLARTPSRNGSLYRTLIILLILADIVFASLTIYWERGIASSSVILFAVPIITSAMLRSRSTLLATAALSAAGYPLASVRYYYLHYGESFRVELYGEVGFFCAVFFILAGLLLAIDKSTKSDS
ncbi:hypothetical protein A2884_00985 [Candidatus Saccharibacteria bacterium RIFCSPHIGHO2_01_FULL_48_12]|nr:MAG: hypothetical protein A2884_00985 [Candidatus Saccharibacteria bacterium RIFCSPHIGHO2_01_FULL_48_12]